jgi:bifunctional DNase/RNase
VIELSVYSVLYSLLSRYRIVLLKEKHGERFLPIWIGMFESEAIAMRLQGTVVPRPLTHDLLANVIAELGGDIQYIVINDLNDSTFFARIAIERDGELRLVDSRPSDAIALAVRTAVPIYVEESVMDKAGIVSSPDIRSEPPSSKEDLDVFRDFVDSLDLDDLGD